MSSHTFPGRNPFGGGGFGGGLGGMPEEEEVATSPTAGGFPPSSLGSAPTSGGDGGPSSFAPGPGSAFAPPDQQFPPNYSIGRRTSVSAESMDPTKQEGDAANWRPPVNPKTNEQKERIREAVRNNFLFTHLATELSEQIIGALFEKPIPAKGIKVISQGDVADNFYIVESGNFDVHIHPSGEVQPGADGMGDKVTSIGPGGSFGELALMYNAPRAATVVSTEKNSLLWALDRVTFKRILMDAAFQRRRMYEGFLEQVDLLKGLTSYERAKVADALETTVYKDGEVIIKEADVGDRFFLLEEGEAKVYKQEDGASGHGKEVHSYKRGDYFGELALLDDKPRAATVVASNTAKCAWLDKDGFRRLLGPVEDRMRAQDPSKK